MSSGLATRCPACQTVFRVVRDQLRVSGGWVRCGRCSEVFEAGQALLDLDTGLPWVDASSPPQPPPPPATRSPADPAHAPTFRTPPSPSATARSTAPVTAPVTAPAPAPAAVPEFTPVDGLQAHTGLPAVFSTRGQNTPEQALWREPETSAAPDAPEDVYADPNQEPASWRTTPIAPPQPEPLQPPPLVVSQTDLWAPTQPEPPAPARTAPPPDTPLDPLWRQTEAPDYEPLRPMPWAADVDTAAAPARAVQTPAPQVWPPLPPPPQDLEPLPPYASLGAELKVQAEPHYKPSFVRAADRAQRWRQPRTRAWLATAAAVATLGLLLQVGIVYRDLAAARLPAVKPVLEAACVALGCTVGPALAINSLVVESSGLLRIERSNQYRLQVALRNRAGIPVALPAIDVTLTDTVGGIVARKVLSPAEMGSPVSTLEAGQSLTLQATLQNLTPAVAQASNADPGAATIAGYTVEVFYP